MKKGLITLLAMVAVCATNAQQLAFPGAQGWGRFAEGGRKGQVYHVTNLNDSGAGSLRDAISQPNRIIVFDVAGVINIQSRLVFKNNLYVAGQTAPGEGITVYGNGVSFSGASNIIVRYMRFRMGVNGDSGKDAAGIANGANMIFDHCSFAWGRDETFSINPDGKGTTPENITLQHSIVGQGLMTHSAGGLMQTNYISLIGNFLCDNSTRNFKIKGINQYANNMVYNWQNGAYIMGGDSEGKSYVNIQSNLFINGPAKGGAAFTGGNADFHCYGVDNWQDNNIDGVFDPFEITDYNAATREPVPYDYPELELNAGKTLLETNLPTVGASLPYRDYTDCYMVDEVLSYGKAGALITTEKSLPYGVPSSWNVWTGEKLTDTDGDGMPDAWEIANGTDPNVDDAMTIAENGYANIENYINSITKADRQYFLRAPLCLQMESSTVNSLTCTWLDYSDNEQGFIIEMKKDGAFVEVGRTAADVRTFTITAEAGLQPATAYEVRVCAFDGEVKSGYTDAVSMKTRPEQVDIVDCDSFTGDDTDNWLIAPTDDETITLTEATPKKAVVVRTDANVTINGEGYISGPASMNKTGKGTLTIASNQQYEGATVLHNGTYEFAELKDGGVPSGLGASQEFSQNWVMDGGTYKYTGASTSTNRSAKMYNNTTLNIAKAGSIVGMSGSIEGDGDLTIDGEGQINVNSTNFFQFDGRLIMDGGTINLNSEEVAKAGLGTATGLVLRGGGFKTTSGNDKNPKYTFPIEAVDGTYSKVSFFRNCEIDSKVSGSGTMEWEVNWLREYLQGNWDDFIGRVVVVGTGTAANSQFAINNGTGIKNGTLMLKGTAQVNGKKNQSTYYLGGLSGDAGTFLSGFDVKSAGGSGTWIVGTANTDEEFRGVIDNRAQGGQQGSTSITKDGSGYWRLTGENVYKGNTTVKGGTLIVNGSNTGTGAVYVMNGATLAGEGSIAGKVIAYEGGTVHAGDSIISSANYLTMEGGLSIKAGAAAEFPLYMKNGSAKSNKLRVKGTLEVNDATLRLDMTEVDEIADDRVFILFDMTNTTVTGNGFTTIEPERPSATQVWDTSDLLTKGYLYVRADGASGIQGLYTDKRDVPVYNLNGQRTNAAGKGLRIAEGKKYIQK